MIDLIPDSDQQGVADTLAIFLRENLPVERHHAPRRGESDLQSWPQLADLGCFGLSLDGAHGGVGMTLVEEVLAFREYGRALVSPAILASVIAARVAAGSGMREIADALLRGRARAGIANPIHAQLGPVTSGAFHLIEAGVEDFVVAWDRTGVALFAPGAFSDRASLVCLDATVSLTHGSCREASPLAWVPADEEPLSLLPVMLSAAMLVGISEAVRDMAVAQAKTRQQFGVPIGTFQAIKHRCADMAMWTEAAWSQTAYAALALRARRPDAEFQVVNAKMVSGESALSGARHNIQVHGGMGFTAELNAHLFLKRVHLLRQLGDSAAKLQRSLLGLRYDV